MKTGKIPDSNVIHLIPGYDKEIYIKPMLTSPNIIVGDFTYIADSEKEHAACATYSFFDFSFLFCPNC